MKTNLSGFVAGLAFLLMVNHHAEAQLKIPQASSSQTIVQSFGVSNITLKYNRPNVNNRKVFGGMEPYDKVWRTGANKIPTIEFEREVEVSGHKLAAGKYGILTIPGQKSWTVIFSKDSDQWGSYTYKQEDDVLRFTVVPQKLAQVVETFTINFTDVQTQSAKMNMSWENTMISFNLNVNEDAEIMESIAEAMKGDDKPYLPAAQYYYKNGKDIKQALDWVSLAEKENDKAPYIKYWKALMQIKAGDKKQALVTAQRGLDLAKEQKNDEYIKLTNQVIALAKK